MPQLPKIKPGILCNNLEDEVLVYDTTLELVHLLDRTTAQVLESLRNGDDMSTVAEKIGGVADVASPTVIELAIEELRKAQLLDEAAQSSASRMNRRELLRKFAVAGATAALVPAIVTLSADRAYAQISCSPKKACCTVDLECCSGKCDLSTTNGCTTGPTECH